MHLKRYLNQNVWIALPTGTDEYGDYTAAGTVRKIAARVEYKTELLRLLDGTSFTTAAIVWAEEPLELQTRVWFTAADSSDIDKSRVALLCTPTPSLRATQTLYKVYLG